MNPTFSHARLKELFPILNECSQRLLKVVEENLGREFDFFEHAGRLTLDAVFNCLFGIEVDMQNDSDNIYMKKTKELSGVFINLPPIFVILCNDKSQTYIMLTLQ
jgi:cytochrome P450